MNENDTMHAVTTKLAFAEDMARDFTIHRTSDGELFSAYIRRMFSEATELMIQQARHNRGLQS